MITGILEKSADRVVAAQGVIVLPLVIAMGQWPTAHVLYSGGSPFVVDAYDTTSTFSLLCRTVLCSSDRGVFRCPRQSNLASCSGDDNRG